MRKRTVLLVSIILTLGLVLAGCADLINMGDGEAGASRNAAVAANATLLCGGRAWPLVLPPVRGNERNPLFLEQIDGTTWKLLNNVVCSLCRSNEWITSIARGTAPSSNNALQFTHPAKQPEVIPANTVVATGDRVNRPQEPATPNDTVATGDRVNRN